MKERFIALDIGNVCIQLRHADAFRYFGFPPDQALPDEFLYAAERMERGIITETEFLDVFRIVTGNRFSDEQMLHGWNIIIGDEMPGMPELLKEICDMGFRLIFFSDTSESHIMHMYRHAPFARLVSGAIFSYEAGAKKPEDAMYQAFEQQYGKPCLYVDDLPQNIAGGIRNGWDSVLFSGVEDFRKEFMQRLN
ncbi:MAG: hypothetical protein JXR78_09890 [Victivallales bacterium]|nr:hypothetical protein [Victivallales bacterium]